MIPSDHNLTIFKQRIELNDISVSTECNGLVIYNYLGAPKCDYVMSESTLEIYDDTSEFHLVLMIERIVSIDIKNESIVLVLQDSKIVFE